jgi:hypothetical protein
LGLYPDRRKKFQGKTTGFFPRNQRGRPRAAACLWMKDAKTIFAEMIDMVIVNNKLEISDRSMVML